MSISTPKLIFFPNGNQEPYTSIQLEHPVSQTPTDFLVSGKSLYALNRVNFQREDDKQTEDSHQPFKALALTKAEGDCVVVGKAPEVYIATQFNPIYFLLAFVVRFLSQERVRLLSYEDLLEKFEDESPACLGRLVNTVALREPLEMVCEAVEENDMVFYRPSEAKIVDFLQERVGRIVKDFPKSAETQLLRTLSTVGCTLTPEVTDLAKTEVALDLLAASVGQFYLDKVRGLYNFAPLDDHRAQQAQIEKENRVAEENLKRLNEEATGSHRKKAKKKAVKAPKVKAGKGALDMFFKKRA